MATYRCSNGHEWETETLAFLGSGPDAVSFQIGHCEVLVCTRCLQDFLTKNLPTIECVPSADTPTIVEGKND